LLEEPFILGHLVAAVDLLGHLVSEVFAEPRMPLEHRRDRGLLIRSGLAKGDLRDDLVAGGVPGQCSRESQRPNQKAAYTHSHGDIEQWHF
jgi:hypothetical protein